MNKIIPALSITVLCGCSATQVKTAAYSDGLGTFPQPVTEKKAFPFHKKQSAAYLPAKHKFFEHTEAYSQAKEEYDKAASEPTEKKASQDDENSSFLPRIAGYIKKGVASWYGHKFHGRKTANGEIFDMYALTAAHKTLPLSSYAEVTNLRNNRKVIVRINDRGPFVGNRLLDLSYAAAQKLAINGLGKVEVKAISAPQAIKKLKSIAKEQQRARDVDGMYMHVGIYTSSRDANKVRSKIAAKRLASAKVHILKNNNAKLYTVKVGPLENKHKVEQVNQQLARLGISGAYTITENSQNGRIMVQ